MGRQLRLGLRRPAPQTRESFVTGASNRAATALLDAWPAWPGGAVALVGPEASGKSHLAQAWASRSGAVILDREAPDLGAAAHHPVLLEDADQGVDAEALFHLINLAGREGASLLLTARTLPTAWPSPLPDLRSRLNALPVALIEPPDDEVLEGVLRRFFGERSIRPADEVYPYLLRRMVRTVPGARELVRRLDEAGDGAGAPISRVLARQILDGEDENLDLFE